MMKTIEITNARARKPEWSMAEPVNFSLDEGEHIAIAGTARVSRCSWI